MHDAPNPWSNQASEEPLQEAQQEDVVDEALVADAGGDHGSDSSSERDDVQDAADHGWGFFERDNGIGAASGAA